MRNLATTLVFIILFFRCSAFAGPEVHPENTIVIKGVIAGGNLDKLARTLMKAEDYVDIVIDSPGGSVETGSRFINYMEAARRRGVTLNCFVPNLAASMAFGILVHCDNRYALSEAFLLWHRARVMLGGMGGSAMTAPQLMMVGRDLEALDDAILRETTAALGMDPELVKYHFESETLHLGSNLERLAPSFITVVPSIPGLLEALHNDKLPHSEKPNPFGFLFGEIIYITERLMY